jgi:hypothetical protein
MRPTYFSNEAFYIFFSTELFSSSFFAKKEEENFFFLQPTLNEKRLMIMATFSVEMIGPLNKFNGFSVPYAFYKALS